jgi:hypothetical protein
MFKATEGTEVTEKKKNEPRMGIKKFHHEKKKNHSRKGRLTPEEKINKKLRGPS